jgi:hypothetical protein
MSINELIDYGMTNIKEFVNTLMKMSFGDSLLKEATKHGNQYANDLKSRCINLKRVNIQMDNFIKKEDTPDFIAIDAYLGELNNIHIPSVNETMRMVFDRTDLYDEEDRMNTHKMCQIFDYLLTNFVHLLNQFKIIYPANRPKNAVTNQVKLKAKYVVPQDEIDDFIGR